MFGCTISPQWYGLAALIAFIGFAAVGCAGRAAAELTAVVQTHLKALHDQDVKAAVDQLGPHDAT